MPLRNIVVIACLGGSLVSCGPQIEPDQAHSAVDSLSSYEAVRALRQKIDSGYRPSGVEIDQVAKLINNDDISIRTESHKFINQGIKEGYIYPENGKKILLNAILNADNENSQWQDLLIISYLSAWNLWSESGSPESIPLWKKKLDNKNSDHTRLSDIEKKILNFASTSKYRGDRIPCILILVPKRGLSDADKHIVDEFLRQASKSGDRLEKQFWKKSEALFHDL